MTDAFARAVYGVPTGDDDTATPITLLARTEGLTVQSADLWRETATLAATPSALAMGIFQLDQGHHLLAYATLAEAGTPQFTYIRLPNTYLRGWGGNLSALRGRLAPVRALNGSLPPVAAPAPEMWPEAERAAALARLTAQLGGTPPVLGLLDAVVSAEKLLILNGPASVAERLGVVMGLMALLPRCARADLTFATQAPPTDAPRRGRVVFGERMARTPRHIYDWAQATFETPPPPPANYVDTLRAAWDTAPNPDALLALVDRFEPLAPCDQEKDFISRIHDITARYHFHEQVTATEREVTPAALKAALHEPNGLPDGWRAHYAALLLDPALEARDTEAHSLIARQMDADPQLDDELSERMGALLAETPDLVYVFMRQRLSEGESEKWRERLHEAAVHALAVVLDGGDPDLVLSWLRLLAREPNNFGLRDVLLDGVEKALPYAYTDGAFALNLLVLVSRFLAEALDELLADERLLLALPNEVRDAFAHYERDALAELQKHGTSLFLAGIGRAAEARAGSAFEAGVIERLWALEHSDKKFNGRMSYTPARVLANCVETGASWLPSAAIETLLGLLLREKDNPLYATFTADLAAEGLLTANLPGALLRAESDIARVLDTVTMLAAAGHLTPQEVLTVYVAMLEALDWNEATGPLISATARVLSQNHDTSLPPDVLGLLLERAATLRDEAAARTAALGLLRGAAKLEEDEVFVAQVLGVFSQLAWSQTARTAALTWWREFVTAQPSARLSRLDDLLAGVRVMEDPLETLRTVVAMRRLIGKRDVTAFAEAVNTAYQVLETLAEAFEPNEKGSDISFEPETIRATLTQMSGELTPHQRQILSNSLKGLAKLIAEMGDNRTKGGLARPSNSVDRRFITGEQMPQGAVDAMKWLAGYFSRAGADDETRG